MVGTFKKCVILTNHFSNSDLTDCEKTSCMMYGRIDRVHFEIHTALGKTHTRECGCQIGNSDDALWLALESWTRNETSHLVCGENITLWDTSKLTVLNHDTMCGPPQDQCVDIVSSKPCPPFPIYCIG